jgi:hypothetical protein
MKNPTSPFKLIATASIAFVLVASVGTGAQSVTRAKTTKAKPKAKPGVTTAAPVPTTPGPKLERGLTKKGSSFATPVRITDRPIKVMPLGDDMTSGAGELGAQSYRGHLYNALVATGYSVDFVGSKQTPSLAGGDIDHEGHGAYSIGPDDAVFCEWPEGGEKNCLETPFNLDSGIGTWIPEAAPDVIIINIGLYDLFEPGLKEGTSGIQKTYDPKKAPERLRGLVAEARRLAPNSVIVVLSLARPTWITSGWGIYERLNAEALRLGEADPADAIVSVNWQAVPLTKADYEDGFHVNDAGAKKLAQPLIAIMGPVLTTLQGRA